MNENVKKFVEDYNKRMDWNKDILDSIAINFTKDAVNTFIDEFLSTDKITEDGYDLEYASIYSYDKDNDGEDLNELQVFNNKTYGTTYFWLKPNETESDYKNSKMEYINNEVSKKISHITSEISRLEAENKEWKTLLNAIKK